MSENKENNEHFATIIATKTKAEALLGGHTIAVGKIVTDLITYYERKLQDHQAREASYLATIKKLTEQKELKPGLVPSVEITGPKDKLPK